MSKSRPPLPPFSFESAVQKVRQAEDAWNTRDPERVALAYTEDSRWQNRAEFLQGRTAIVEFLKRKFSDVQHRFFQVQVASCHGADIARSTP